MLIGATVLAGVAMGVLPTVGDASGTAVLQTGGPVVFNFVPVGQASAPSPATISNVGGAPLSITGVQVYAGHSDFEIPAGGDGCSGQSIAPGRSCSIEVIFRPTAIGTRLGSLAITDSRGLCTNYIVLAGSGEKASAPATATRSDCQTAHVVNGTPTTGTSPTTSSSTSTSTPPPATSKTVVQVKLSSTAQCTSKRQIKIHLKLNGSSLITGARIYLNGHLTSTTHGHNLRVVTVSLRGAERGRYGIRVVVTTANAKTVASPARFFVTCVAGKR